MYDQQELKHLDTLRGLDAWVNVAQELTLLLQHSSPDELKVQNCRSKLFMWLPEMLVRYVPLMSDRDLCLLCNVPDVGPITDLLRETARLKTEHIEGIDGFQAFELVRLRRHTASDVLFEPALRPVWDKPQYQLVP